jgi:hypothetical protein
MSSFNRTTKVSSALSLGADPLTSTSTSALIGFSRSRLVATSQPRSYMLCQPITLQTHPHVVFPLTLLTRFASRGFYLPHTIFEVCSLTRMDPYEPIECALCAHVDHLAIVRGLAALPDSPSLR